MSLYVHFTLPTSLTLSWGGRPASQGSASHFTLQSSLLLLLLLLLVFLEQRRKNKIGTCQIGKEKRERIYIYIYSSSKILFPSQGKGKDFPPVLGYTRFYSCLGATNGTNPLQKRKPV